ncbi:transmembrane protein 231-like [Babylonia areolata]|uniref:transmembrane protein 231-like n=1 Tax=Babylonia areolata TaxID=304850 RepID=UPI003FD518D1
MAVFEVFAHPELRRYKTTIVSKATVFQISCFLLTFIVPLFIAYRSGGFWFKESTYQETPVVAFKHELMLVLDLQGNPGDFVTYSTFQAYNQLQENRLRIPLITSREEDENGDGRADMLKFNLEMPLMDTENVVGVRLVLFFYYKLLKYSSFHMESLAIITEVAPSPAAKLYVNGDLVVRQKQALAHRGIDSRFNDSLIDSSSSFAEEYNLQNLIEKYNKRNVTTRLVTPDKVWTSGRGAGAPFILQADIAYPAEETYRYRPGFWYMIKWGWVQYLAVLVLFLYIFERVKVFVFVNQLVTTIVERITDNKNKMM